MNAPTFDATEYRGSGPENYEKYFVPAIAAPLARELVDAAALQPGERVLDVACGTGVVTRLAAARVGKAGTVAGLDVNPGMLAVARAATPENVSIDWYETSIEATPLPDAAFDVVLCQMGLQFVADKVQALKEMRRMLAPRGRLVLNLPGPTPTPLAIAAEALARHIDRACAGFVGVVFSLHDAEELRALMARAGFVDVAIDSAHERLRVPRDFLWQYIHSTPLAAHVAKATDQQRRALADEVADRWQPFVDETGALVLDVQVTTVKAR